MSIETEQPARPRVYYLDSAHPSVLRTLEIETEILHDTADLIFAGAESPDSLPEMIHDAQALIVAPFTHITPATIAPLHNLRLVVRNGVGYDNIDAEGLATLGIPVSNVPDYGTEEVADHAMMLALALERKLLPALQDVRQGNWNWRVTEPVRRLRGQRFGIIGCGRIGTAVALRAKAFGFDVQFYDPYVASGYEKAIGVSRCSTLNELLASSDVVSLHCPVTRETRGLIGLAEIRAMKQGAFLINTARGPIVKEAGLIEMLRSGHLGGAALDVLEREPARDPELYTFPNFLVTPHEAFYSVEALEDMRVKSAQIVLQVLKGEEPINVVNGVTKATTRPGVR